MSDCRHQFPVQARTCAMPVVAWLCGFLVVALSNHSTGLADQRTPTVGAPGRIEELILPGSELTGKPIQENAAMVVRVVKAFKHGDGYRYEIMFHGFEPGKFDLSDWLVRKDGSSTADLPPIEVEIQSLLPPGQVTPNELEEGLIPSLGGYRTVATAIGIAWVAILVGLIFYRKRIDESEASEEAKVTLADVLRERLQDVESGRMGPEKYAELERILFGLWRRRLHLDSMGPEEALREIRKHPDAGPLMNELEQWMHNPAADRKVELNALLEPYTKMSPAEIELAAEEAGSV